VHAKVHRESRPALLPPPRRRPRRRRRPLLNLKEGVLCLLLSPFSLADLSWLLGHLVSGLVANAVAEVIGRKCSLLLDCAAFAAGFALYAGGNNFWCLAAGRALLGYPLVNTVSEWVRHKGGRARFAKAPPRSPRPTCDEKEYFRTISQQNTFLPAIRPPFRCCITYF